MVLLPALTTAACSLSTALLEPPKPPQALLAPCPPPPLLEGGSAGTVLRYLVDVLGMYAECRERHAALSEAAGK